MSFLSAGMDGQHPVQGVRRERRAMTALCSDVFLVCVMCVSVAVTALVLLFIGRWMLDILNQGRQW